MDNIKVLKYSLYFRLLLELVFEKSFMKSFQREVTKYLFGFAGLQSHPVMWKKERGMKHILIWWLI